MTVQTEHDIELLNYVAEDIALARKTALLAAEGCPLSWEQFLYQTRQLERALERLAEYREMLKYTEEL